MYKPGPDRRMKKEKIKRSRNPTQKLKISRTRKTQEKMKYRRLSSSRNIKRDSNTVKEAEKALPAGHRRS